MRQSARWLRVVSAIGLISTASCEGTTAPAAIGSIVINPSQLTLASGESRTLAASVRDFKGRVLLGRPVTWSSSNPALVSVTSGGVAAAGQVLGGSPEAAIVSAASGDESATVPVTVLPVPVSSISVSPSAVSLAVGGSQQLTPFLTGIANGVLSTLSGRTVTWSSSNPAVANVSSSGLVAGLSGGTTTITASSEGQQRSVSVTVLAPVASVSLSPTSATLTVGGTQQLTATLRDASNNILTGRTITWSSSNAAVASVSSSGLVTGASAGSATITATSEGRQATASVTVQPPIAPVASVSLTPSSATIGVGGTQQLTATLRDASNNILTGRTITWSSSNAAVASVSSSGLVTGVATGSATITATSEGRQATASISVTSPSCSSTSPPGDNQFLCGNVNYALPTTSAGFTRTYFLSRSSSAGFSVGLSGGTGDADLEIISPAGGLACSTEDAGNVDSCSLTGAAGTWTIRVLAFFSFSGVTLRIQESVASVTLSPTSATIGVGGTQQLTATLRDAASNVLTGRTITWTSSNTSVASVSASGLVTGVSAGTSTITATSEGRSATAAITVSGAAGVCQNVTLLLGQTANGSLQTGDCLTGSNLYDRYALTLTSATVVASTLSTSAFLPVTRAFSGAGSFIGGWESSATGTSRVEWLLPSGSYEFNVRGVSSSSTGSYSFGLASVASDTLSCGGAASAFRGVTVSRALTSTDCVGSRGREDKIYVYLTAGQTLTATMTATFDTYMYLYAGDGTTQLTFDDDGGGGTNSRIVYQATQTGYLQLRPSAYSSSSLGTYTITLSW